MGENLGSGSRSKEAVLGRVQPEAVDVECCVRRIGSRLAGPDMHRARPRRDRQQEPPQKSEPGNGEWAGGVWTQQG